MTKVTAFVALNWRCRKIWNGSIGWASRRSIKTNEPKATTVRARAPRAEDDDHPRFGPSMRRKVTLPSPAVTEAAPAKSMRPVTDGSLDSGT